MPTRPDWRAASESASLNQLERSGFAWEFLRRNVDYRAGYARVTKPTNHNTPEVANAAANFARHWGLNCTGRPDPVGRRGHSLMAPRTCADRSDPHASAPGLRKGGFARSGAAGEGTMRPLRRCPFSAARRSSDLAACSAPRSASGRCHTVWTVIFPCASPAPCGCIG